MIIAYTEEMYEEDWKEMRKWIKDNTKYGDEWSTDIWNVLNDLRHTIEKAKSQKNENNTLA